VAEPIFARGPLPAPVVYTVPGSSEIIPLSAYADFDGTSASGTFVPVLIFRDQAGNIIGQSQASTSVAAGASASMSWFPGVKAAAAAAAASSGIPVAIAYSNTAGVTIASSALNTYVSLQDGVNGAGFATTSSSVFANASSTSFNGSAVFGIQINAAGTYEILTNTFDLSGGTAGRQFTAYWAASNGSAPSFFQQGRTQQGNIETWDTGQAGQGPHLFTTEWMTVSAGQVGAVLVRYAKVPSGGAITATLQLHVKQLSTSVLAKL
jgi:hypothetical protein